MAQRVLCPLNLKKTQTRRQKGWIHQHAARGESSRINEDNSSDAWSLVMLEALKAQMLAFFRCTCKINSHVIPYCIYFRGCPVLSTWQFFKNQFKKNVWELLFFFFFWREVVMLQLPDKLQNFRLLPGAVSNHNNNNSKLVWYNESVTAKCFPAYITPNLSFPNWCVLDIIRSLYEKKQTADSSD